MTRMNVALLVIVAFGGLASTAAAQPRATYQQTQYKGQEIGKLTGDVYYARMDDYLSVFMVTPDGIVLVEPIGTEFATWLKGELATRFKVPVKYVIYSHHHWDHGSGAAVYADVGKAWSEAPGISNHLGVLKDVGIGLRVGQTRSAHANVVRIDLAMPLDDLSGKLSPQFLISTGETF